MVLDYLEIFISLLYISSKLFSCFRLSEKVSILTTILKILCKYVGTYITAFESFVVSGFFF